MNSLKLVKALQEIENPSKNPWHQFSEWLYCVAVVTFDLELGQAMEVKLLLILSNTIKNCLFRKLCNTF